MNTLCGCYSRRYIVQEKLSLPAPRRPAAGVELRSTHSARDGGEWSHTHSSTDLSQGEDPEPVRQKTGWAPEILRREKYLAPTWMR